MIKSRRMRWGGHTACMEEMRNVYRTLVDYLKGIGHLADLGVCGRIILKYILKICV
jgi:hypothetical protein